MGLFCEAPGEAGAFQRVEVPPGQGRSGPPSSECCVLAGDGPDEAYTVIVWGWLLSRERTEPAEAEAVQNVEGNMCGTVKRGADALPWSKTHSRTKGTRRNLGGLRVARNHVQRFRAAPGSPDGRKPAMHDPEESSARIVPRKPPNKAARRIGGGGGGGKA